MEDEVIDMEAEETYTYEMRGFIVKNNVQFHIYQIHPSDVIEIVKMDETMTPSKIQLSLILYSKLKYHSDLF